MPTPDRTLEIEIANARDSTTRLLLRLAGETPFTGGARAGKLPSFAYPADVHAFVQRCKFGGTGAAA